MHIWTGQPFFAQWIFAVWQALGDLSNSNFFVSIVIILVMTLVAGCPVGVDALIMVIKGSAGCGHQMHVFHISSPPPRYLHLYIQTKDLLYKYTNVSRSQSNSRIVSMIHFASILLWSWIDVSTCFKVHSEHNFCFFLEKRNFLRSA